MNRLIILLTFLIVNASIFGQNQPVAVIVEDESQQLDMLFISKIAVMLFLGVVALFSYLKFRKSES